MIGGLIAGPGSDSRRNFACDRQARRLVNSWAPGAEARTTTHSASNTNKNIRRMAALQT
jgi:hypothetical protein